MRIPLHTGNVRQTEDEALRDVDTLVESRKRFGLIEDVVEIKTSRKYFRGYGNKGGYGWTATVTVEG
jgi:hypothetical protein